MSVSQLDIEIATTNLNAARNKPQFQNVFEELKNLFNEDPQNVQVRQLMESLADKAPGLVNPIRRVYEELGFQFRPEDPILEELKKSIQEAVYAEDVPLAERLYEEYTTKGGGDVDTDRRMSRLRTKAQPGMHTIPPRGTTQSATIPFEVRLLKNELNSTINKGLYPQAINLAQKAMKILEDQDIPATHPDYTDLEKGLKEATDLRDAREQLAEGMELMRAGSWRDALILYERASDKFHQPYLEEQRDALRNVLQKEKEILEEARSLIVKTDQGSIERIFTLIDGLKNLPGIIGLGAEDNLPAAQKAMLEQLSDKLQRTKDTCLRDAKHKLELANRETDDNKADERFADARSLVEFVRRLDDTDENAGKLLQEINIQEQERHINKETAAQADRLEILRRNRNAKIARGIVVIAIIGLVTIGAGIGLNTWQTNNANATATQFLLDGSSTALALTESIHIENATATQNFFEVNMTQTRVSLDTEMTATAVVLTQTQAAANANSTATQSIMEATSQERSLQLTLAAEDTRSASTAIVLTQTQAAANATATREIVNITSTFVALPTATSTPPDYVCLGRTVYGVTLRIRPNGDANSVGVIPQGSQVQIFDYQGSNPGWYQVINPDDNAGGWVYADGVTVNNCPASLFGH